MISIKKRKSFISIFQFNQLGAFVLCTLVGVAGFWAFAGGGATGLGGGVTGAYAGGLD